MSFKSESSINPLQLYVTKRNAVFSKTDLFRMCGIKLSERAREESKKTITSKLNVLFL